MTKKLTFEKIKIYFLIFLMIGIPAIKLLSYILFLSNVINNSFMVNQVYVLWALIPFLIILYIYGLYKKKDKICYLDIIIYFLIILAIISTIFAIDVETSIYGGYTRNEGLLSIISYYLIFLNAKSINNDKDKELLINIFFILGIFQVLYSIIQIYTGFGIVKRYSIPYLAMGLCANPNFLGSYMAMLVILASSLFILRNKKIYLLLAIIYNIGLSLAQSTGPFLSIIICFIFMMIYLIKKGYMKRIIIIFILLIFSFLITNFTSVYVQKKYFGNEIETSYNIIRELNLTSLLFGKINKGDLEIVKELGNNRIKIWLNLLPKVKEYWLTGTGLDNIVYIYPHDSEYLTDKAHNCYLQILITNGLFALIIYLSLYLITFIKGLKLKDDISISLYMLFIVYAIQAFLNISVIDVAPYFFLFYGLLSSKFNEKLLK